MEPERNREVITMHPTPETYVTTPADGTPVATPHAVIVEQRPAQAIEVVSTRSISPHAIAAGLMAIAMILWGGVIMARTGFEGDLAEPQAEVLGLTGNALSGSIIAGLGLLLLLSALSTDRAAVMFTSIIIGVGALIATIEPTLAGGELGLERSVPVLLVIGSGLVLLLAALVPTATNRTRTIDRI